MDSITIYPENERQKSLLKSLLKEMKVRFEIGKAADGTILTKEQFIAKIDKSAKQADLGKTRKLNLDQQKGFLGL